MSFQLKKVLLLDGLDAICAELLNKAGIVAETLPKLSKDELIAELKNYDGVVVRSATKLTADVLDASSHLKVVGRAGTGVDNIDIGAATKNAIVVMNTPGGNTLSAAEHTCNLICSLSRSIPQACASLKEGKWDRKLYMGNELFGKVLAIIGLGRIGREVSNRMKSFGMRVIGFDPIVAPETAASWGIEYYSLDEIWPKADYITVHTPLIPQTRNLIGEASLSKCKPTVRIVNVARGGIVDEKALLKALEEGRCGGAGLDVFEQEPPQEFSLVKHPKVICTPHLGASTVEAQKRVAQEIAEQFIAMSKGTSFFGIVNTPELEALSDPNAQAWKELATYLGAFASYNTSSPINISINVSGNLMKYGKLVRLAVLSGALTNFYGDTVNLVNASTFAEERKITASVNTKGSFGASYESGIIISITGNALVNTISGTLLGKRPVLYEIDGSIWSPELQLGQNTIVFRSDSSEIPVSNIVSSFSKFGIGFLSLLKGNDKNWCAVRTVSNSGDIAVSGLSTIAKF